MSLLIYIIGLRLMEGLAWLISPFRAKVRAFVKGRHKAFKYLETNLSGHTAKLLWVHASSVGEYEQSRPILELYKAQYPKHKILVSFYSPSGYEALTTDEIVDFKCYLPLDSRSNARRFIKLINPSMAFFIKYEFWHFYLDELSVNNIPTFSVSSIFRPSQAFFKWYGGFFRNMLQKFDYFFVQDQPSQDLLKSLNIESMITGDTRIDRVLAISEATVSYPVVEAFIVDNPVFIIGSMRKEDIALVKRFIRLNPEFKFIIAPHEITEEMMRPLELDFATARYTDGDSDKEQAQVLIIDTIGMLSKIYRYGNYAYVGGGFSDGIHNILEPAVYKLPVFFGNQDYTRFKEAMDLTSIGAAFAIGSADEMQQVVESIISDKGQLKNIQEGIEAYLKLNRGASNRIIDYLNNFSA